VAPGGDVDRDDTGPDGRPDGRPDGILQQAFDPDLAAQQHRYDDFAYWWAEGTSMATAHVSAVAALLYHQGITNPAAIKAARVHRRRPGAPGDDFYGHGLIRPRRPERQAPPWPATTKGRTMPEPLSSSRLPSG
jgi:serine protease